jgi:multicomponent Na+:H+ antiporter subunit G
MVAITLETLQTLAVAVLLAGGVVFTIVAAVGLVRLPDLYSRTHAASKSETLGAALALAAVAVAIGPDPALAKVVLLLAFVFVTGPTAAHAIARAAHEEGFEPWERPAADSSDATVVADGGVDAHAGDAVVADGDAETNDETDTEAGR